LAFAKDSLNIREPRGQPKLGDPLARHDYFFLSILRHSEWARRASTTTPIRRAQPDPPMPFNETPDDFVGPLTLDQPLPIE